MWGFLIHQMSKLPLVAVVAGLGIVAYLDFQLSALLPVSHLYYLPIILGAVCFGYRGGLLASGSAMGLELAHFALTRAPLHFAEADLLRFTLFLIVGVVTARLVSDRRRMALLARQLSARNEELSQLNSHLTGLSEARADFVAMASHELRTPLTTITGSAQLLARTRPADVDRQGRLLTYIIDSTRRLERTVENLLDAALIESGHLTLKREQVSLGDLIGECVRLFQGIGAERLVLPELLPKADVTGDRDHLLQVLTNLIGNALKYSPAGTTVTLVVEVQAGCLLIKVSDQGPGIPPEELPRIFDRYYRAGDGRAVRPRGAGLGLSISRKIVEAHGGSIKAESQPGKGATFTVALPLTPAS